VISCGGIGATPDDYTRQALASALGVELTAQPEAQAILARRFGEELYPHRIRLCEFPQGAKLVPNPVNQVAGCHIRSHFLLPGFPEMAWPMTDWLLENCYADTTPAITRSVIVPDAREGQLIDLMQALTQRWPAVRFSSLPSFGNGRHAGPHIDFSVTGTATETQEAMLFLQNGLQAHGLEWQE
jgi:molybdopterin-biosynthesis enzyme MoeA-like protein